MDIDRAKEIYTDALWEGRFADVECCVCGEIKAADEHGEHESICDQCLSDGIMRGDFFEDAGGHLHRL